MTTLYERCGGEILANSTTAGAQYAARIAYLADGRFVIVWRDDSAFALTDIDLRGQIFLADGTRSGGEFVVNSTLAGRQTDPAIVALSDGGFLVSWTAQAAPGVNDYNIVAQRFAADGSKAGGEVSVASGAPDPQNSSAGAALTGGGYVLAWADWAGDPDDPTVPLTTRGIRARQYDSDGNPLGEEILVNTTTAGAQSNPSVAALPDGGWLISWDDSGGTGGIAGQRFASGGSKAGPELLISIENAGVQVLNVVAVLEGGGFVVAWQDSSGQGGDASGTAVKARLYDSAGAAVGGEILVNGDTAGSQSGPAVTALPGGGFVIAWTDSNGLDGSGSSVRAQIFDSAGAKVGEELQINSSTAGYQGVTDIVPFDGGFTIVWTDESGEGGDPASGGVKFARILASTATEGDDVRFGTDGVDDLYGLGGNDTLSGGDGADVLVGGDGDDTLEGGAGNDELDGGAGNDQLSGGDGDDLLDGGEGDDVADGGAGDDRIVVAASAFGLDAATGGAGNDRLTASFAAATAGLRMEIGIGAGGGYEGWIGPSAEAPLLRLSGIEQLHLSLGGHADEVSGGDLDDSILGMGGDDVLAGGGGNDLLDGGTGADRLEGGAGDDSYVVDDAGDLVVELAGGGTDTVTTTLGRYTLSVHLENLTGSAAGQALSGNHLANVISGEGGDDVIDGGAGTDTLSGGAGNDVITDRDGGEDVLNGGDGDDLLSIYHYGWDRGTRATLNGGAGNDVIVFDGLKFATIDAGAGDDTIRIVNASDAYITLGAGRDTVAWDNWISGTTYLDTQTHYIVDFQVGSEEFGADRLDLHTMFGRTLAGWDQRTNPFAGGGARLDVYQGVSVISVMFNGSMTEAIEIKGRALSFTDYNLGGFSTSWTPAPATTIDGSEDGETLYGTAGADTISGLGGNDRIEGGFGADIIDGGDGDDVLNGQTGDDLVEGGAGNDRLEDHAGGEDRLSGGEGNDFISASRNLVMVPRTVTLNGGGGDDVIWFDWLVGRYESPFDRNGGALVIDTGTGADTVVIFDQRGSVSVDLGADPDRDLLRLDAGMRALALTVANFTPGDAGDTVDMADHLARTLTGWDQRTNPFSTGHLSLVAYEGGTRLMVDRDGGGDSYAAFITFANAAPADFSAANFGGYAPGGSAALAHLEAGSHGDDVIVGGVGDDLLSGLGGDDTIHGGVGDDLIEGGGGHDRLFGGGGSDEVSGGAGDDYIEESEGGADRLSGEDGHDRFVISRTATATPLTVSASGGAGEDRFSVTSQNGAAVEIDGGDGDDHITFFALKGSALLTLGAGRDVVRLDPDYFGPNTNQTRVKEIVISDFQGGPGGDFLDIKQALDFGAMHWPDDGEGFRQGSLRLVESGGDTLLQYTYSSSGPFQTLFRFTGLRMQDLAADNFDMELPQTLILSVDGERYVNSASFYGRPAVLITANDVHFTNAAGATLSRAGETGTDLAAIRVDGEGVTIVNEFGAAIRGGIAIEGTESADTILNYGLIAGAVQLGGGNDYFFEKVAGLNNSPFDGRTPVDLGAGDDLAEFDVAGRTTLEYPEITGGAGWDKAIIRNIGATLNVSLAATLDVEEISLLPAGATAEVTFSAKAAGVSDFRLAAGLKLSFADSASSSTPFSGTASGTVHLEGGSLSFGLGNAFAKVIGTDAAETVTLLGRNVTQIGTPTRNGEFLLGGGDDRFVFGARHVAPVKVDGGAGNDRLEISQAADLSLATFSGFETIVHSLVSGTSPASLTLSAVGADVERLLTGASSRALTISGTAAPNLVIGATTGRVVIAAGSTVGSVQDRKLVDSATLAASAQSIENRGTVSGDVLLGDGNDSFTAAAGSAVGGAIRGGAGNDVYIIEAAGQRIVELENEGADEIRTSLAAYALDSALHVETLTGLSASGQALTGNELANTISAGSGADVLNGGGGDDALLGGGGDDLLDGGAGDDTMTGGAGNDVYIVDSTGDRVVELENGGSDEIRTGLASYSLASTAHVEALVGLSAGGQALTGNGLANRIVGGGGADSIDGGGGDDILEGGGGDDSILGGAGNDRIDGGPGADSMTGGTGDDVYLVDDPGDVVVELENEGSDEIRTSLASYTIGEAVHVETLTGTSVAGQTLSGNSRANSISGGGGNDRIDGGGGDDRMAGGLGDDIYVVSDAGDVVIELENEGSDEIRTSLASYSIGASVHVETLTGTAATGQTLNGNGRANSIFGGDGNDLIDGGAGDDRMAGGLGDDVYVMSDAGDLVVELADQGSDEIRTSLDSYTLGADVHVETLTGTSAGGQALTGNALANSISGGAGNDRIDGGAGDDRMAGGLGDDMYVVSEAGDVVIELENEGSDEIRTSLASYTIGASVHVETLTGTSSTGQALAGNGFANSISGGGGNDLIDGGAGDDRMAGGLGDDVYIVSDEGDVVVELENQGSDEIRTSLASYTLGASVHVETLTGTSATGQTLTGNGFANSISGGAGNDLIDGGGGDDRMAGGPGDDVYIVSDTGDVVVELENEGSDEIRTSLASYTVGESVHVETLTGTSATGQALTSNGLANIISGGAGNDLIDGGLGDDRMAGGLGDDIYVVSEEGDVVIELENEGSDEIRTSLASYRLGDAVHVERLTGTSAAGQTLSGNSRANAIFGSAGNDVLDGGGGNDLIDGGAGDDRMAGGTGDDVYFVDSAGDVVVENAGEGTDEVRTTLSSYALPSNVELLTFVGTGAFTATGSGGNDRIRGGSGDDMLSSGAGNDILNLSDGGDDVAEGGSGEDIFFYGAALTGADRNDGGSGTDTLVLQGRYSGLVLTAASLVGIEGISLQSGSITRWGEDGTASYDYDLTLDEANTAPGQQLRINAQSLLAGEDFAFDGSNESDGGRFLVYAGFGTDLLTGGSGNDIFYFEAGRLGAGDRIVGGAGNDAVVISGVPVGGTTLSATIAAGTLSSVESLSVNGRFATDLSARPSYELVLENGNAALGARLIVNGSSLGADQSLAFDGSRVQDALLNIFGGAGADRLTGGANADTLYAGGGADLLTGGGGADLFQYRSVSDSTAAAPDGILDFVRGTDRIDLSQIDADSAAAGDQGFAFIGSAAFSGVSGQLRSAFVGPNLWRVEGDVDGDRVADFVLEVIGSPVQPLTASDFLL